MKHIYLILSLALVGCGSDSEAPTFNFFISDSVSAFAGDYVSNDDVNNSDCVIGDYWWGQMDRFYESSNPAVARISGLSNDEVTAIGSGTATITGYFTNDYNSDCGTHEQSFTVTVIEPEFQITAAIGEFDTHLYLTPGTEGITLMRSFDPDCDIETFGACIGSEIDIVGTAPIVDTTTWLDSWWYPGKSYFKAAYGNKVIDFEIASDHVINLPAFDQSNGINQVVFDNLLWFYNNAFNEVWISNGTAWAKSAVINGPPNRSNPSLISFNGELFYFGGTQRQSDGSTLYFSDSWYSLDGSTWRSNGPTPFDSSCDQFLEYGSKLWCFYTRNPTEAWSSSDGLNWTNEVIQTPYISQSDRAYFTVVGEELWAYNIYQIGISYKAEIWASADGRNWSMKSDPGYTALDIYQLKNGIWINAVDQIDGTQVPLLLHSINGIDWVAKNYPIYDGESVSTSHSFVYDGKVYNGWNRYGLWSSSDSQDWREIKYYFLDFKSYGLQGGWDYF